MSYNGAGTFNINSAGQPAANGAVISSAVHNALTADLAAGLTNAICKDGQTTIATNIPFSNKKITGLGDATALTDAANLNVVMNGVGVYVTSANVGGTADVITLNAVPAITAYTAGQTFRFVASGTNTTNVTVNVSALGAKAVTAGGSTALTAGQIRSGAMVELTYDGTRFVLTSDASGASLGWFNVINYGAVGDGTTDDGTAIQAAIDAAEAAGGGIVYFPQGTYKITGILTVSNKGVRLVGASMYSTTIKKTSADCTSINFDNAASDLCAVEQLRFIGDGTTQTSGGVIKFTVAGSLGTVIDRVLMEDVYCPVLSDMAPLSINDVIISRCEFLRCTKYGVYMKGALNWLMRECIVSMADGAANTDCLVIDGSTEGCLFVNNYFLAGEYVLRLINSCKENKFAQCIFDGGSVSAACIYDSGSLRTHFLSCWASTQGTGGRAIVIDNANVIGFVWAYGEIIGIQQHGVVVTAVGDFHIEGGRICNWGIQAASTYSGITVAAGASVRFTIKNVIFAQDADISGNSWNGININSGTYGHYEVMGNSFIGLTGASIADSGTCGSALVMNNPGYNPLGVDAPTVGASPYTYTANHNPETIIVSGGTVSDIKLASTTIFTSTDKTVHLAPNQSMTITYSSAPTLIRSQE